MPSARRGAIAGAAVAALSPWRALFAQPATPQFAGIQMSVSPTMLELSTAQRAAIIDVAAIGADAIRFQVRLKRWQMRSGRPFYEDTDDIAVSPPLATVQSGRSQTVRVVVDSATTDRVERAYRLFVNQLPGSAGGNRSGVTVALETSLPVFVAGQGNAPPRLQTIASQRGGEVELIFRNDGDSHTRLTDLSLKAGSATITQIPGLVGYVLARSELAIRVPTRAPAGGIAAVLDVTASKGASIRSGALRIDG